MGKSHVDEQGGHPPWGDDASRNRVEVRSVLWLPSGTGSISVLTKAKPQWYKYGKIFTWKAVKDGA